MLSRSLLVALLVAVAAPAEEIAPERLLPSSTQIYFRWDGVKAHQKANAESAVGRILAGETGKMFASLWERFCEATMLENVGSVLLSGESPDALIRKHARQQCLAVLPRVFADHGIVIGMDFRFAADVGSAIRTIRKAIEGGNLRDNVTPAFQMTVVIPGAANRPEVQTLWKSVEAEGKKVQLGEQSVYLLLKPNVDANWTWWKHGDHIVMTLSTFDPKIAARRVIGAGSGITKSALFREVKAFDEFEVVTRAYIDGKAIGDRVRLATFRQLPLVLAVVQDLGLLDIGALRFYDGFEGRETRTVVRADIAKEQRGLAKLFVPKTIDWKKDLPPLPADATRWVAGKTNPTALYDMFVTLLVMQDLEFGESADKLSQTYRQKKEEYRQEIDSALGVKVGPIFGALGDTVLTYHSPGDGLPALGQVFAVSVKDEKFLSKRLDRLGRKLMELSESTVVFRMRPCEEATVREFVVRGTSPVTVSYTIHKGWLVFALHPQPVRGFLLRSAGKLPTWKPSPELEKRLAKVPKNVGLVQVVDPRPTLRRLLGVAPALAGLIGELGDGAPFFEAGLLPHAGSVTRELFPNIHWSHFDGKTMHWESRNSLALPFQEFGLEWLSLYGFAGLATGL